MKKNKIAIFLLFLISISNIDAEDAGKFFYINSLDVEAVANIPLSGISDSVIYSLGGMTQLNFKFGDIEELSIILRAGAGIYDSPVSEDLGLYNFTALLGVGYNLAIGESPVVITPSLYGGVIGHVSKSYTNSLESVLKNIHTNQILGADLELSYMPWIQNHNEFFGFYSVGSFKLIPVSGDLESHFELRAGLRFYFQ